jgi:hypothetical protein
MIFAAIARFLARFHRARNPNRIGPVRRLMGAGVLVPSLAGLFGLTANPDLLESPFV